MSVGRYFLSFHQNFQNDKRQILTYSKNSSLKLHISESSHRTNFSFFLQIDTAFLFDCKFFHNVCLDSFSGIVLNVFFVKVMGAKNLTLFYIFRHKEKFYYAFSVLSSSDLLSSFFASWRLGWTSPRDVIALFHYTCRHCWQYLASPGEMQVCRLGDGGAVWMIVQYAGRRSKDRLGSLATLRDSPRRENTTRKLNVVRRIEELNRMVARNIRAGNVLSKYMKAMLVSCQ